MSGKAAVCLPFVLKDTAENISADTENSPPYPSPKKRETICLSLCGVIFLCKSDIVPWYYIRVHNCRRQYHPTKSDITAKGNITRRKANITEKSTCDCKCFFLW